MIGFLRYNPQWISAEDLEVKTMVVLLLLAVHMSAKAIGLTMSDGIMKSKRDLIKHKRTVLKWLCLLVLIADSARKDFKTLVIHSYQVFFCLLK